MLKRSTNFCFVVLFLIFFPTLLYAMTGSFVGIVTDSRTGEPLIGVNVFLPEYAIGRATDENGRFEITDVSEGTYTVVFSMIGYRVEERRVEIERGKSTILNIMLKGEAIKMEGIIVTPGHYGIGRGIDEADEILGVEEIKKTPGTQGDLFMVLSTLPGVASQGPSAPIYVQGGRPEENLVLLDQGWVASAFHMELGGGGIYSIFNPAILREVNLYTGGFGVEYGDNLSAVLNVETHDGDYNSLQGSAALSTAFVEFVGEGPLFNTGERGSFLFSARRSYFDLFIKFSEYREFFEVFPNYYDFAGKVSYRLSQNQKVSLTGLWASDNAIIKQLEEESDIGGVDNWYSDKALISLRLQSFHGMNLLSQFALSASQGRYRHYFGDFWYNKQTKRVITVREDIRWNALPLHRIKAGFVFDIRFHTVNMSMPIIPNLQERPRPDMPVEELEGSFDSPFAGVYLADVWSLIEPLTIEAGLRSDYFFKTKERTVSPRLAAALQIIEEVILHAAWGIYYQTPPLLELAEEFGNPSLLSRKAQHFVGGFETELPQFSALRLEGFYKMFDNLPLNDSLLGFLNKGNGFSYGFGILLQRCGTSKLNG